MWRGAVAIALGLALSSCSPDLLNTKPEVRGLTGAADMQTLEDPGTGTDVHLRAGGIVTIILPANPTTGYVWQVKPGTNDRVVEMTDDAYVADKVPAGIVGSGGQQVYVFEGKSAGKTDIKLAYARIGQAPVDVRVLHVQVRE